MNERCQCCKNNLSINEHIEIYLNTNIPILIEKSCGYNFMLYLNEYSTLIDLYRYVEQFYNHVNETKVLFLDNKMEQMILRKEINIKDYFIKNNVKPFEKCLNKCIYKFYLTFI